MVSQRRLCVHQLCGCESCPLPSHFGRGVGETNPQIASGYHPRMHLYHSPAVVVFLIFGSVCQRPRQPALELFQERQGGRGFLCEYVPSPPDCSFVCLLTLHSHSGKGLLGSEVPQQLCDAGGFPLSSEGEQSHLKPLPGPTNLLSFTTPPTVPRRSLLARRSRSRSPTMLPR